MASRSAFRLAAIVVGVLFIRVAVARAMPLEPKLQATLLNKIIAYDSTTASSQPAPVRVLVVYQSPNAMVKKLLDAFREVGLDAFAINEADVESEIANARVLYLMPDVNAAALSELSARAGTLSVSGAAGFAEVGQSAVGLGLSQDGRPQIVVNLAQAQREGHRFAPQFLSLTRIVR